MTRGQIPPSDLPQGFGETTVTLDLGLLEVGLLERRRKEASDRDRQGDRGGGGGDRPCPGPNHWDFATLFLRLVFLVINQYLLIIKPYKGPERYKETMSGKDALTCLQLGVHGPLQSPHDPPSHLSSKWGSKEPKGLS